MAEAPDLTLPAMLLTGVVLLIGAVSSLADPLSFFRLAICLIQKILVML